MVSKLCTSKAETIFDRKDRLFGKLPETSVTWMSHGDYISRLPEGFKPAATTAVCPTAAIACAEKRFYGVQFHPEVRHTQYGRELIRAFLFDVCGAKGDWTVGDIRTEAIRKIREQVGDGTALLALSGGVDSSVAAALMAEAIGDKLTCGRRGGTVPLAPCGRDRAGTEAQDHRRGVYPRV